MDAAAMSQKEDLEARMKRFLGAKAEKVDSFQYNEPPCYKWTHHEVGDWIANEVGMPKYRPCFVENLVTGRKLVMVTASSLPRLGVTYFEDIKHITKKVRELLDMAEPSWYRCPADGKDKITISYLEWRSQSGHEKDQATFESSPFAKWV